MSAHRRDSAKKAGGGSWKERLRSECFERLRQERQRILWAARGNQGAVQGALQQLITDVSGALGKQQQQQQGSGAAQPQLNAGGGGAAVFAPPVTPQGMAVSVAPAAGAATPGPFLQDIFQLEGEEYEELMRALEESLLEDRLREEAAYLERLEQQEVHEAVAAYYNMAEDPGMEPMQQEQQYHQQQQQQAGSQQQQHQHQQEGGSSGQLRGPGQPPGGGMLCPLCGQAPLVQHKGVILCPRQDLRLDVSLECLTLKDLKQRLEGAVRMHSEWGCSAQPAFVVQQQGWGGGGMLCLACQTCGCLEVVL